VAGAKIASEATARVASLRKAPRGLKLFALTELVSCCFTVRYLSSALRASSAAGKSKGREPVAPSTRSPSVGLGPRAEARQPKLRKIDSWFEQEVTAVTEDFSLSAPLPPVKYICVSEVGWSCFMSASRLHSELGQGRGFAEASEGLAAEVVVAELD
jgi:hypothetical protein